MADAGTTGSGTRPASASGLRRDAGLARHLRREPRVFRALRAHGFRWLQVADAAAVFLAAVAITVVRFGTDWPTYPPSHYFAGFAIATVVTVTCYYFAGLYERDLRIGSRPFLPQVASATVVAMLVNALIALLSGRYLLPRASLIVLSGVATLAVTANRALVRWAEPVLGRRSCVLLVGGAADRTRARHQLERSDPGTAVVGEVDTDRDDPAIVVELARTTGTTHVLLVSAGLTHRISPGPLDDLDRSGVRMLKRIDADEALVGLREIREIGGMPFVLLRTRALPRSRAQLKRLIELAVLLLAAPLLLPVVAITAAYVRTVAGRPALFRQERVGRGGVPFPMLKFRTMRVDAEEGIGPVIAAENDPRVLRGCQWLRDTRLDELPNLWNVLRGQMSIVGPRPERPDLVAENEELIPGYRRRHEIPPGITGLAQIHGSYHTDPAFKIGYDLQYLVNWSPVLDLEIALRTIWVVVARRV